MQVTPLAISGVALITPRRFDDERGWFMGLGPKADPTAPMWWIT